MVAATTPTEIAQLKQLIRTLEQALDNDAASTACKVFVIPELLEMLLLHLSTEQLFGVQGVCRTFRLLTERSRHLRGKVFLEYLPKEVETPEPHHQVKLYLVLGGLRFTGFSISGPRFAESEGCLVTEGLDVFGERERSSKMGIKSAMTMNITCLDVPVMVAVHVTHDLYGQRKMKSKQHFLHGNTRTLRDLFDVAILAILELKESLDTETRRIEALL